MSGPCPMRMALWLLSPSCILRAGKPSNQSCRLAAARSQIDYQHISCHQKNEEHVSNTLPGLPIQTVPAHGSLLSVLLVSNVGVISWWSRPPSQHLPNKGVSLFVPGNCFTDEPIWKTMKNCCLGSAGAWLRPRFQSIYVLKNNQSR